MIVNEIEDFLSENEVFLNAISGEPSHSDSYMTVVDFGALRTVLKKNTFKKEDWLLAIECWKRQNVVPTLKVLGKTVERMFESNVEIPFPQ